MSTLKSQGTGQRRGSRRETYQFRNRLEGISESDCKLVACHWRQSIAHGRFEVEFVSTLIALISSSSVSILVINGLDAAG
jgi:hypothetical protein